MDEETWKKLMSDISKHTQKIANQQAVEITKVILDELKEKGVSISEEDYSIKRGRPRSNIDI